MTFTPSHTRPRPRAFLPLLAALALLPQPRAGAASIIWDTPTILTLGVDTDVSTTGSLLYAFNLGDIGVTGPTLNGVTFTAFPVTSGVTSASQGSVTISTSPVLFSYNFATSPSAPYTSLTSDYQALVSTGLITVGVFNTLTLGLGGLTLGNTYQVQVWASDANGTLSGSPFGDYQTIFTAGNAVTLDDNNTNFDGGVGQWVTGSFTADAATQNIAITCPTSGSPVLNAFQVRTLAVVPEPASATLLALGAGLLAARRRRR